MSCLYGLTWQALERTKLHGDVWTTVGIMECFRVPVQGRDACPRGKSLQGNDPGNVLDRFPRILRPRDLQTTATTLFHQAWRREFGQKAAGHASTEQSMAVMPQRLDQAICFHASLSHIANCVLDPIPCVRHACRFSSDRRKSRWLILRGKFLSGFIQRQPARNWPPGAPGETDRRRNSTLRDFAEMGA